MNRKDFMYVGTIEVHAAFHGLNTTHTSENVENMHKIKALRGGHRPGSYA